MNMPEYYEEHDRDEKLKKLLLDFDVPRNRVGFLIREIYKIILDKQAK